MIYKLLIPLSTQQRYLASWTSLVETESNISETNFKYLKIIPLFSIKK